MPARTPSRVEEHQGPVVRSGREIRREALVSAMIDGAMDLVREGGIEGLTLQKLAKSLGYVATAVYRYFPSKDALVAALQRTAIGRIQEQYAEDLRVRAERFRGDPAARDLASLVGAAEIYLDLPETQPKSFYLVAVLLGDPQIHLSDEESLRTAPILRALLESIGAIFVSAQASGALTPGPVETRTLAFWAALHGATCLEKARRVVVTLPSSKVVGMAAAIALLRGWGAPAELLARAQASSLESARAPGEGGEVPSALPTESVAARAPRKKKP